MMAGEQTAPNRIALRVGLERLRADFERLMDDVSDPQWGQQSRNTRWSNGDVLVHLLQNLTFLPRLVDRARRGKDMLNFSQSILAPVNFLLVKWQARRYKRSTLKTAYGRAIEQALATLDGVRDDEWELGGHFFGAGFQDIAQLFQAQIDHFAAHETDVRAAIGRPRPAQPVAARGRRRR